MKQHEAVEHVLRENGGYATLGHLYQAALKVSDCNWGTKTPFASIRKIVQINPKFFKIKPGLWGLSEARGSILKQLSIDKEASPKEREEFGHSYYQGLVVEIGNLKNYETFVPSQDRNRPFLSSKLSDIATLNHFYNFTYENLVHRARTIDIRSASRQPQRLDALPCCKRNGVAHGAASLCVGFEPDHQRATAPGRSDVVVTPS